MCKALGALGCFSILSTDVHLPKLVITHITLNENQECIDQIK